MRVRANVLVLEEATEQSAHALRGSTTTSLLEDGCACLGGAEELRLARTLARALLRTSATTSSPTLLCGLVSPPTQLCREARAPSVVAA